MVAGKVCEVVMVVRSKVRSFEGFLVRDEVV